MNFENYKKEAGVNWSTLKHFFRSPAHVRHYIDQQESAPSQAQSLGVLQHMALLQPELFEKSVYAYDKIDGRTADGKAQKKEIDALRESGKLCLERDAYDKLCGMSRAVFAHEDAKQILNAVDATEKPIFWEEKGIKCKGLLDMYSERGKFIGDIKTTSQDCRFFSFQYEAAKYHYYGQAAYYLRGAKILDLPVTDFIWLVVETEPPHGVAVYQLSEVTQSSCQVMIDAFLAKWQACVTTQKWPAYNEPITPLDAPESYFRKLENQ